MVHARAGLLQDGEGLSVHEAQADLFQNAHRGRVQLFQLLAADDLHGRHGVAHRPERQPQQGRLGPFLPAGRPAIGSAHVRHED
jgi:hypothetical protein